MDSRFNDIFDLPENNIFRVVFYPDRIYHAQALAAARSRRYRYNVMEVRSQSDLTVMKGEVYRDELFMTNFLRVEYRAHRLVELAREQGRALSEQVLAFVRLPEFNVETTLRLHYAKNIDAYASEVWSTLDGPDPTPHDFMVLDLMGWQGAITRVPAFNDALADVKAIRKVEIACRENDRDLPFGYRIGNPQWDNNYTRNFQAPNTADPSSDLNTVKVQNYLIDFQRGWFLKNTDVTPVRYRNPLMEGDDPERHQDNIIEMRWILQRELGSNLVFFHEVIIPPGKIEGTHRHIGSEELYYIVEGEGIAYMGEHDDPALAAYPVVERSIFGIGKKRVRELPVSPGHVIYTKSGGIHGIRNPGMKPLRFVAFLYHNA
ncbi:MAG: cupin domain-containing protein [Candidatus Contendobacter sp.]|nr:cupin domain-containing protein [Candidatus Contendobacter sp.]